MKWKKKKTTLKQMLVLDPAYKLILAKDSLEHYVCYFYRTQVNLGSDLWVRMSVTP